jgi:DNA-binding response OmpR family regulator
VRVLIVDDEVQLATTLARGLRRRGLTVDVAHRGDDALEKAAENAYDVVVLDRDLPVLHGDEVCRRLVADRPGTRVLMLTAAASLDDLVAGLGLGADDYLVKPFRFAELVARIAALARRTAPAAPAVLRAGDVTLDPARFEAVRGDRPLHLTPREFAVLEALLRSPGQVLSAEQLFELAWDDRADPFTSSVRVIVSRLRAKLGAPELIHTVVGRGYRVEDGSPPAPQDDRRA